LALSDKETAISTANIHFRVIRSTYVCSALTCQPYSASYSYSATQGYATCGFTVCGSSAVSISLCGCSGDTYIRLYDSNGNYLSSADDDNTCLTNIKCSSLTYFPSSYYTGDANKCSTYYLHEGCNSIGLCSGTAVVSVTSGSISSPGTTPSTPALYPTMTPYGYPTYNQYPSTHPASYPTVVSPSSAPAGFHGATSKYL